MNSNQDKTFSYLPKNNVITGASVTALILLALLLSPVDIVKAVEDLATTNSIENEDFVTSNTEQEESTPQDLIKQVGVLKADIYPVNPQKPDNNRLFYYEIKPGDTLEDEFYAINHADKENSITVYSCNKLINEQGTVYYSLYEETPDAPASWLDINSIDVTLDALEYRKISFKISVPEETPLGSYGVGFALQKIINTSEQGAMLNSAFRKITPIEINVTDTPAEFVKKVPHTQLIFEPTIYFWLALTLFILCLIYYFFSKKNPKDKNLNAK